MAVNDSYVKGAYHIANNTIEYNPQRVNNFTLVVKDLGGDNGLLRSNSVADSTNPEDYILRPQEEIMLALKSCSVPSVTQNQILIQKGNSTIKFPNKPTFSDMNISAYDLMGSNIKDTLYAWQNLCYNRRYDYVGNKSSYKKNCTLYEYTPDGDVVRYWELEGVWPTTVTVSDFDTTSGEVAMINATLSVDRAELHLPDEQ